jgi:hypothetical protein
MTDRLRCEVMVDPDEGFPKEDAHPFWTEIDALADEIAALLAAQGVTPEAASQHKENGSFLTISSDVPPDRYCFWIALPAEPARRARWLATCLDHLTRARTALPDAHWEVFLKDQPIPWSGRRFRIRPFVTHLFRGIPLFPKPL